MLQFLFFTFLWFLGFIAIAYVVGKSFLKIADSYTFREGAVGAVVLAAGLTGIAGWLALAYIMAFD